MNKYVYWDCFNKSSLGLVKHTHDVINLLYYEHWTDKWKFIPYLWHTKYSNLAEDGHLGTWYMWCTGSFFIVNKSLLAKFFHICICIIHIWVSLACRKVCSRSTWKNSPRPNFYSLPTNSQFSLNKSYNPTKTSFLAVVIALVAFLF